MRQSTKLCTLPFRTLPRSAPCLFRTGNVHSIAWLWNLRSASHSEQKAIYTNYLTDSERSSAPAFVVCVCVVARAYCSLPAKESEQEPTEYCSPLSFDTSQFLFDLFPTDLGIPCRRLNRWRPFLRHMSELIRNLFQRPTCFSRPTSKIMAETHETRGQQSPPTGGRFITGNPPPKDELEHA